MAKRLNLAANRRKPSEPAPFEFNLPPTKQRPRTVVIGDLGENFVERQWLRANHSPNPLGKHPSYDQMIFTYDSRGYREVGTVLVQVKSTDTPVIRDGTIRLRVDAPDVRDWLREARGKQKAVLVVYLALRDRAYWGDVQELLDASGLRRLRRAKGRITVRVPTSQPFTLAGIRRIVREKNALRGAEGAGS